MTQELLTFPLPLLTFTAAVVVVGCLGMLNSLLCAAGLASVPLATFDGAKKTVHRWTVENDPVMGGRSVSNWTLAKTATGETVGEWRGSCRIVPSLHAPGFTIALTSNPFASFPDVSSEDGLLLGMRNVPLPGGNVTKFQAAFCDSHIDIYRCQFASYKAAFTLPHSSTMQEVFIPWSRFSDKWSAETGAHTKEDPPTSKTLKSISQLQLWVEGVEGDFHVWLHHVSAGKKR